MKYNFFFIGASLLLLPNHYKLNNYLNNNYLSF